ncbi:hypothetical protein ACI797_02605 [Geodermatophilus sp. SYSU D00691]
MRRISQILAGLSASAVLGVAMAAPASAAAFVQHPDETFCFFEPGDVPGVDEFFPAECTIITTDTGRTVVVARGQLPEGYSLDRTFVGTLPCFGGTGRVTATVSGQVRATCQLDSF